MSKKTIYLTGILCIKSGTRLEKEEYNTRMKSGKT